MPPNSPRARLRHGPPRPTAFRCLSDAHQESDGHAQVSGMMRRGTRVIWRKLDCLKPNFQKTQRNVRRKDVCYRLAGPGEWLGVAGAARSSRQ
jgi:hypothetical protein